MSIPNNGEWPESDGQPADNQQSLNNAWQPADGEFSGEVPAPQPSDTAAGTQLPQAGEAAEQGHASEPGNAFQPNQGIPQQGFPEPQQQTFGAPAAAQQPAYAGASMAQARAYAGQAMNAATGALNAAQKRTGLANSQFKAVILGGLAAIVFVGLFLPYYSIDLFGENISLSWSKFSSEGGSSEPFVLSLLGVALVVGGLCMEMFVKDNPFAQRTGLILPIIGGGLPLLEFLANLSPEEDFVSRSLGWFAIGLGSILLFGFALYFGVMGMSGVKTASPGVPGYSAFGQNGAFGQAGGIGQNHAMGQNAAFGQNQPFGSSQNFGQPQAFPQGSAVPEGFGQPINSAQPQQFGQPVPPQQFAGQTQPLEQPYPNGSFDAQLQDSQRFFDVILESSGERKVALIKTIRELTSLGLKEAKEIVDSAPRIIFSGVDYSTAVAVKSTLEASGASVTLR